MRSDRGVGHTLDMTRVDDLKPVEPNSDDNVAVAVVAEGREELIRLAAVSTKDPLISRQPDGLKQLAKSTAKRPGDPVSDTYLSKRMDQQDRKVGDAQMDLEQREGRDLVGSAEERRGSRRCLGAAEQLREDHHIQQSAQCDDDVEIGDLDLFVSGVKIGRELWDGELVEGSGDGGAWGARREERTRRGEHCSVRE